MLQSFIVFLIKLYRYAISPLFPPRCRFIPTCSEYAILAIKNHGLIKGLGYSCLRLLKCHPFHPGGLDPVK